MSIMSQGNCETEVFLCRLCGTENGVLINIFESSPNNECIRKIEAVVPDVVILRDDSLSKHICHRCVAKVKEFYDFKGTCIKTQKLLKSKLLWMSPSQKTAPLRVVSPTIHFIGGPLAYPFGQKEPEVEVLTLSDDEDGVETQAALNVDHPSGHVQSHPSQVRKPTQSVWNGNAAPGQGTQNTQSSTARMGSSGRGNTSMPSHSFRSFVQFNQIDVTQPAAKRPCKQSTFVSPKKPESDHQSVNRRLVLTTSPALEPSTMSRPFTVATPSTLATSPSMSRPFTVATPSTVAASPTMSRPFAVATSSTVSKSFTEATPSMSRPSPIVRPSTVARLSSTSENNLSNVSMATANAVAAPRPNEDIFTKGGENSSSSDHRDSGSVLIPNKKCDSTAQPKPKPKPKSKKKPVEFTDADINNIRNKYPSVECVKICGNTIIFTCTLCNKMLLTEEAILNHVCLLKNNSMVTDIKDNGNSSLNENGLIITQSKESNCSTSCYVELSSDDETSSDTEKHMCSICSRLFHSASRLQKHFETH